MPKPLPSDSEGEDVDVSEESSPVAGDQGVPDYERQRLSRIAENKKRMEALGLHKMAKSLMKGSTLRSTAKGKSDKGKRKIDGDEDEDYNPNSEEELDKGDSEDTEDDYVDEDFAAPGLARKKGKSTSKSKKKKKKSPGKKLNVDPDFVCDDDDDDDDDELMQAIALSLQDSAASPGKRIAESTIQTTKDTSTDSRGKKKKQFTSRVTMTEDDLVLHFFQLDDAGKGAISVRDLERVALSHDFIWSDKELEDMIRFFDSNNDLKLDLEDFRRIAQRCHILQTPEGS